MFEKLFAFIKQLYPNQRPVPLHAPIFLGNEKKYLNECIDSTYVSYIGPFVKKFEEDISSYTGAKHALAVCNGTVALQLGLISLGVSPGDEVILPSLTFVATANAISHTGAHCLFVDCQKSDLGIDPNKLREFLANNTVSNSKGELVNKTSSRKISACVLVHIFGHSADVESIVNITNEFSIPLVEDSSEALGSFKNNRHLGTFSQVGILSFNGNKTITSGGGGMLLFQDKKLADYARYLASTAKEQHPYEFIHNEVGYNFRLPNINAAVGCAQLERVNEVVANKRQTANAYREFFLQTEVDFFREPKMSRSNYWLNAIITQNPEQRNKLLSLGLENGIQFRPVWRPMHLLPMYKKCQSTDLSYTEFLAERLVNLPSSFRKESLQHDSSS